MMSGDGGSAFPLIGSDAGWHTDGMSLRDWFAGQALAGAMVNASGLDAVDDEHLLTAVRMFYRMADAMMEARK